MTPVVAFALASALHAGFQATVTVLVYPALGARSAAEWQVAHARHSRSMAPLVGVVYGALLISGGVLVAEGPGLAGWFAVAAAVGALGLTATAAAPLHARLADRDDILVSRLLVADRARCAFAVVGALLCVVAMAARG